ncbi:MAG TPA: hypothetical protein VM938_05760 [Acidimicrobiales bacterium]|nr:hypothetical protein [Acidimicrobiales bacterium]
MALPSASALVFDMSDEAVDLLGVGGLVALLAFCVACQIGAGMTARRADSRIFTAVAGTTLGCLGGASVVLAIAAAVGAAQFLPDLDVSAGVIVGGLGLLWLVGAASGVIVAVVAWASRRLG